MISNWIQIRKIIRRRLKFIRRIQIVINIYYRRRLINRYWIKKVVKLIERRDHNQIVSNHFKISKNKKFKPDHKAVSQKDLLLS